MLTVKNNIIPFKGFTAITLWPFIFVRKDEEKYYTDVVARHENIHGAQQKEILIVLFYVWYLVEWLVKWAYYRNSMTAYKNISFEREAYRHQNDAAYLDIRKHYAWTKYIINN